MDREGGIISQKYVAWYFTTLNKVIFLNKVISSQNLPLLIIDEETWYTKGSSITELENN